MTNAGLKWIYNISRDIEKIEECIVRLKGLKERITHEISDLPSPTGYQYSRIEEISIKIEEYEKQLNEQRIERACLKAELVKLVEETVSDELGKAVVIERYGFGKRFQEIASELNISESHVYYLHRHALKELGVKNRVVAQKPNS